MNDLTLYRKYREQIQTGDLLSYRTAGIVSGLIHLWSPDNHSGIALDMAEYRGAEFRKWTLEAVGSGTRVAYLSKILEEVHGEVWWHPLKPEFDHLRNAVGCFALEQVGVVKYDFGSLIKNAFGYVSADLRKLFCSEYVFLSWRAGGIVTGTTAPRPSGLPLLGVTLPPVLIVKSQPIIRPDLIPIEA